MIEVSFKRREVRLNTVPEILSRFDREDANVSVRMFSRLDKCYSFSIASSMLVYPAQGSMADKSASIAGASVLLSFIEM